MSQPCVKFFEKTYSMPLDDLTGDGKCLMKDNKQAGTHKTDGHNAQSRCDHMENVSMGSNHSTCTNTDSTNSSVGSSLQDQELGTAISLGKDEKEISGTPGDGDSGGTVDAISVSRPFESHQTEMKPNQSMSSLNPPMNEAKELSGLTTQIQDESGMSLLFGYITQAGFQISQAVEYEANSQFELAFSSYKAAISCLLNGVQDDPSDDRKSFVQRKVAQYLIRAEQIYHNHLDSSHNTTRSIPDVAAIRPNQVSSYQQSWKSLEAPLSDLRIYKVLGTVSSVILALNTVNNTPYVVKVLHKSSWPISRRTKSIMPRNVPFMCRLYSFIENDRAVFLIVEQARGGRLWDHVSPYFEEQQSIENSRQAFACFLDDCTVEQNQGKSKEHLISQDQGLENQRQEERQSSNTVQAKASLVNSTLPVEETDSNYQTKIQDNCMPIPEIIIHETLPVRTLDMPLSSGSDPENRSPKEACQISETDKLLKNSKKLLDLVNKTLSKSEDTTFPFHETSSQQRVRILNTSKKKDMMSTVEIIRSHDDSLPEATLEKSSSIEKVAMFRRDPKQTFSKERKSSSSRRSRSRSRIRFSCDDMFEGRARALSKSLDREALQRTDPRSQMKSNSCIGLPLDTVRVWAAQLLLALDALHRWGIIIGDLRPDNLLLGENLNLIISYQCWWVCVDNVIHQEAIEQLYAAPEVASIQEKTAAADWWSYGAILFELLSGQTLETCHPGGIHSYSTLYIPSNVPEEGASLLRQLLRFEAQSRLGAGPHGVAKLKSHAFFHGIEWNKILLMSASV